MNEMVSPSWLVTECDASRCGLFEGAQGADAQAAFAQALESLRIEAGLSIRDIAKLTGVPHSTIGGYLTGRHLPYVTQLAAVGKIVSALTTRSCCVKNTMICLKRAHWARASRRREN